MLRWRIGISAVAVALLVMGAVIAAGAQTGEIAAIQKKYNQLFASGDYAAARVEAREIRSRRQGGSSVPSTRSMRMRSTASRSSTRSWANLPKPSRVTSARWPFASSCSAPDHPERRYELQ